MAATTLVAITGTIGSGKSLVGDLLKRRGFLVVDTDQVVHWLFANNHSLQRAVAARFGSGILTAGGEVDRTKLGAVVFDDDEARKDLESMVHPAVLSECNRLIHEHAQLPVIFFLVPLLFEMAVDKRYNKIWSVIADERILMERLKARTGLPDAELEKRIKTQIPQSEKAARSHKVIDNSGTIDQTAQQVEKLLAEYSWI